VSDPISRRERMIARRREVRALVQPAAVHRSTPRKTFRSLGVFICCLREVLGLDPRADLFQYQGAWHR
jgi:hypothetical protein